MNLQQNTIIDLFRISIAF